MSRYGGGRALGGEEAGVSVLCERVGQSTGTTRMRERLG